MEFKAVDSTPASPSEGLSESPSEPIEQKDTVEQGKDIEAAPSFEALFKDTMDTTIKDVLANNGLANTEENQIKALNAIKKVLPEVLKLAKIDTEKDVKEDLTESIDDALEKRFMEKTAANYKKVIQLLLGEKDE